MLNRSRNHFGSCRSLPCLKSFQKLECKASTVLVMDANGYLKDNGIFKNSGIYEGVFMLICLATSDLRRHNSTTVGGRTVLCSWTTARMTALMNWQIRLKTVNILPR